MGGDEFVLVLPGLRLDQLPQKLERLKVITAETGQEVCGTDRLSLSIGHALFPDDGTDADRLLSEADRRMYLAKQKEKLSLIGPRGCEFEATATW
jgi:diguanylate cyclase (GGDEF)-like protein